MLPHWRLALARYRASPHKTQRTLSKLSERSVCCFSYNAALISVCSSLPFSFCPDSLFGFLCLWRNGRDRGVAACWPTHPASDAWTQSQLQLAWNANARLKDMLFNSFDRAFWTAEYLFWTHMVISYKKRKKKNKNHTHLASVKDIMQIK